MFLSIPKSAQPLCRAAVRIAPLLSLMVLAACGHGEDRGQRLARLTKPSADAIWADPALRKEATELGADGFAEHCAECHGADLKGVPGQHVPDLTDANWLYGGDDIDTFHMRASDMEKTILHGIHAKDVQSRNLAEMPSRGAEHDLTDAQIGLAADYVLKLSGQPHDAAPAVAGQAVYEGAGGCYDCHTVDGIGDPAIGAVNLTQPGTWLYGHDRAAITRSIAQGRRGVSPAFAGKISSAEAKAIAVFTLSRAAGTKF
jgi:cytochrome c oxidase cbb3-type subunit 3